MSCKSIFQGARSTTTATLTLLSIAEVVSSSNENQYNQAKSDLPNSNLDEADWIQEVIAASSNDTRKQPWKSTFTIPVDSRFDNGQDIVTVKKSGGGTPDPLCPFNTQGSSLAA